MPPTSASMDVVKAAPSVLNSKPSSSAESDRMGPSRYFIDTTDEGMENSDNTGLIEEEKEKLNRVLNKIEKMKMNYLQSTTNITANNLISESNSMQVDQPMETETTTSSAHGTVNEDLQQITVPKRRKLGKLPSFIPLD